jgi:hypothetical protein
LNGLTDFQIILLFFVLVAFGLYVYAIFHPRKNNSPNPGVNFRLDIPTSYKHVLTVADEPTSTKLVDALTKLNLRPTVMRNGQKLQVCFTAMQKLTNMEALKKDGVILDFKIEEVTA